MTFSEELKSRNFSIYGQWTGILCVILCFAMGIANIFSGFPAIIFSIICLAYAPIIFFVEVAFLLKLPIWSEGFRSFFRRLQENWPRIIMYLVMSIVQWISLVGGATSLIVPAIFLLFAGLFYLLAAVKHQEFQSSKILGGQGVAQMII
ncbi:golgi apparatus membrane protein tvp18 [Neofusicoccum parvum]|uniref:Golgi apparatus membrane protein tvp18 n=3 Tax=Neofusicoccum TaxID=407951 RepID=A0ACB5S681_9PEZI|nr:putative golgi apparatus membrane protein tvp18 protein [Neofusicoccum parvum UCRNP2]GME28254.1 golgi apparatus membrane protein tvp18 [Neofusicoccum parvum]GME63918.1 golgi apparatus membrane protein tvp18 [Neofusicoccum parvum]